MFVVFVLFLTLAITLGMAEESPADAASKPNLIYILLDDAGYADLSCYGQKKFQTPNIDRIAKEGLKFTDHYAGCTVCAPTRCCLMTGLHTGHAVVRGNREVQPEGQASMPADIVTIPRLLRDAGYATGAFGKWGLGAPGSASDPANHFDEFFGYNCQRQAHNYYPTHLWHNRKKIELDSKTYSHDLIMAESLNFIRSSVENDKPFFCFLPITIPHAAMHVPEESAAPFRKKFPQFEDTIGKYKGPLVKNPAAGFAGMMTRLDSQIGELMLLLKELDIDRSTLVMLTSDNGPHKEGGHMPEFFDSNGPLRGIKRDVYEGGIRVPLVARWPGTIEAGTESSLISAHWDVLPTLCELAGAKTPEDLDGISMVSTLTGKGTQQPHKFLYWEFPSVGGKQAIRMGKWKGVRLQLFKNPKAKLELYDLSKDLGEKSNIAADHPDIVAKLEKALAVSHVRSEDFPLFGYERTPKKK
ncbi:MAG: arylsulfatase [Planctomycetes bacterium]|nr:arylsulfatase [Planctomycetota bacterium]